MYVEQSPIIIQVEPVPQYVHDLVSVVGIALHAVFLAAASAPTAV